MKGWEQWEEQCSLCWLLWWLLFGFLMKSYSQKLLILATKEMIDKPGDKMLLKQWRTSSSRLEKLPSIPLGLGIYLFKDWHSSESPLRWDENISKVSHALLEQRIFLGWSHPFHVSCCLLQLPRALGLSLQPQGISVKFLFYIFFHPVTIFYVPPSCLVHGNPPVLAPKGKYFEMETGLLDSWEGGTSQGVGIELVPALPLPHRLCSSDKMKFLVAQQWCLGTVCGARGWESLDFCVNPRFFSVNVVFLPRCFSSPWASGETLTRSLFLSYKHPKFLKNYWASSSTFSTPLFCLIPGFLSIIRSWVFVPAAVLG